MNINNNNLSKFNINDLIELYNVKLALDNGNEEYIQLKTKYVNSIKNINKILGKQLHEINNYNICSIVDKLEFKYVDNFFEAMEKYNIYKNISCEQMLLFLTDRNYYLQCILKRKKLVEYYNKILKEILLSNEQFAELLIDSYCFKTLNKRQKIYLPTSLEVDDKNYLIKKYVHGNCFSLNYLTILANFKFSEDLKIDDEIRSKAKDILEIEKEKIFDNKYVRMKIKIMFSSDLKTIKSIERGKDNLNFFYNSEFVLENLNNNAQLLKNFICLFDYVDMQNRWNMCCEYLSSNLFEMQKEYINKGYNDSIYFKNYDTFSNDQLVEYYKFLKKYNVRLEDIISWYFNEYLNKHFKINSIYINMPSENSNYFEKCRFILPEIENCLRQFCCLKHDKSNTESIYSNDQLRIEEIVSLLCKKYVYLKSDKYKLELHYIFSNNYFCNDIERIKSEYKSLYELLIFEKISIDEVNSYDKKIINELVEAKFIKICDDNLIEFVDVEKIKLFKELYERKVINYYKLNDGQKNIIDDLVEKNVLFFKTTLFSKFEQDYLSYNLNSSRFDNSLDLRNKYLHGKQGDKDMDFHFFNYIRFLKLFVLIIIKIDEELSLKNNISSIFN